MIRLEMKNYNAASKIPALSSGNIEKYEYLTGEDILPSNQQQIIEQAEFTYSLEFKRRKKHPHPACDVVATSQLGLI